MAFATVCAAPGFALGHRQCSSRSSPAGRKQRVAVTRASAGGSSDAPKVVGVGSAGVDYLASIAEFPKPDAKLRTDALEVQGGGNAGNALTAMSRLGIRTSILSKIADDGAGKAIFDEFARQGSHHYYMLLALPIYNFDLHLLRQRTTAARHTRCPW